jgi:UDP-N-acetylglucosamine 2-epimerase (non-hydrolysing)
MPKKKICIVLGTRPEIIKLFPLIHKLKQEQFFIIFSNQHYSKNMSLNFFNELKIDKIKYIYKNKNKKKFINNFYKYLKSIYSKEKPTQIIVQGDTETSLLACLAAREYANSYNEKIPMITHIEAGLRSNDYSMPEELNRIIIDHNSDLLFVPTVIQKKNLIKEGIISKKIYIVGNTIADSIEYFRKKIPKSPYSDYILLTFHRHELLENIQRLKKLINLINKIVNKFEKKILFPIHPRTKKKLISNKIILHKNVKLISPKNYLNFLSLIKNANFILSDSGGLQEECCILNKEHITLRNNTERPETISLNANIVSNFNFKVIKKRIEYIMKNKKKWTHPYKKNVSKKILDIISL